MKRSFSHVADLYIGITFYNPITLETDYTFVASFLAHDKLDRSSLMDMKKEAIAITKLLPNFKLVKINRQTNEVAHQIAKFSFDNRPDGLLCNSFPPCVVNAVRNDCMQLF